MGVGTIKRISIVMAAALLALLAASVPSSARKTKQAYQLPPVKHVFVIMLENESYGSTFGDPSAFPYMAGTLVKRGVLLRNYYGTGHESNDNYVSIVSGQPPNTQNQADCHTFDDFIGGTLLPDGVESGTGCVYPAAVKNIGNQLSAKHLSWKGYMEDMGNVPGREDIDCGHPALNMADNTQVAVQGDGYAVRHDPFVYFHSVIDNSSYCDAHVVRLQPDTATTPDGPPSGLAADLKKASTTPAFSFIVPNLCNDGHDYPCINQRSGSSAGADIDSFLQTWVPKITGSPAFKHGGLLEITFDEAAGLRTPLHVAVRRPGPAPRSPAASGQVAAASARC